jgi:hypothetical protein
MIVVIFPMKFGIAKAKKACNPIKRTEIRTSHQIGFKYLRSLSTSVILR